MFSFVCVCSMMIDCACVDIRACVFVGCKNVCKWEFHTTAKFTHVFTGFACVCFARDASFLRAIIQEKRTPTLIKI